MPPLYDNHQAEKKDVGEIEKIEKYSQKNFYVRISNISLYNNKRKETFFFSTETK